MPRVLVVRGHQVTPWELAPWTRLPERFDVRYLATRANRHDIEGLPLQAVPVRTLRDRLPRGRVGDLAARVAGDRFTGADDAFAQADIVHAEELSYWFSAEAARRRLAGGRFRLVQTVWETLPLGRAYRNGQAKAWREQVIEGSDLFLAATRRARDGLLLEGVAPERIEVAPPGIDATRFGVQAAPAAEHLILAPGRLTWEKGHHDLLRAVAMLRRGLVQAPALPRVLIVGEGPERDRLRAHAADLGVDDMVEVGAFVPYAEMPGLYARASCLVLASLSSASMPLHLFDVPRAFWEEQFGMVLAEAMAAGLDVVASHSGAIPEVLGGHGSLVPPGDPRRLAEALARGPLSRPPGTRVDPPHGLVERYSLDAAASRLAAAYDRVLQL